MHKWLNEFQIFRAEVNAEITGDDTDYKELCNTFIKRFEEAILNG